MNLFEIPRVLAVIFLCGIGYALSALGEQLVRFAAWIGNYDVV